MSEDENRLRRNGESVAWRNEADHEPGRWFVINEGRWTDEAEVSDWEEIQ